MIAVPDFAAGAMENWGLIIYRETALLYDPEVSSTGNQQWVAIVVSHELAHQVDQIVSNRKHSASNKSVHSYILLKVCT